MPSPKDIVLKPIESGRANDLMRDLHYSGKVVPNSQLHIGAFLNGRLEGALQFGPPMDKRKVLPLVEGTEWNGMMELNRMAFSDDLPRNSESRALGVTMQLMEEFAPHVEWVLSYADATQCGYGTIYRAANFVLTGIRENKTIVKRPDGGIGSEKLGAKHTGGEPLSGYQLRYIYFINDNARDRLTVPEIPYEKIDEVGAGMYLGERVPYEERNQAPEA